MPPVSLRTLVGSVLCQRWRIVQKLGDGALGEVYSADPLEGGARVAVKVLRPEFLVDGRVRARFAEEGRVSTRLVHPNIVRTIECSLAEDGAPYLVMELLDGVPLGAYTRSGVRVPPAQAVAILHGILTGLSAAHSQGIVHRDLKPDNVFLVRQAGGTFIVKLLDFAMAGVLDAAGGMGMRARSGVLLGTTAYMSPEQAANAGEVDARSDLFSAGVILYEMLTGRAAFPAPTEYARLSAILSTEPEPIDRVDPALSGLASFVGRSLRKNRDQRFASAVEMALALSAAAPSESARVDGAVGALLASGVVALQSMPVVPSAFAPSLLAQTSPVPGAQPSGEAAPVGRVKPGGTMPSPVESDLPMRPAPEVSIAAIGETLPSQGLPVIGRREPRADRVARPVVGVLVAISLVAGVLLGWILARGL